MNAGTVEFIYIASGAAAPTHTVNEVRAIPGAGLEGDRYAAGSGTFSKPLPDRELTLIEAEAIEAPAAESRHPRLRDVCKYSTRIDNRGVLRPDVEA